MPATSFNDHFSGHAAGYARHRPHYPEALFAYVAACCAAHELAWDCGTGNGQAARGLAPHIARIVATDASAAQIAHAAPHERITYRTAPASQAPLEDASTDLVTVAQALHWFPLDAFYREVRRVLKPGGVLAAWTYTLPHITPAVDAVVERFYRDLVGPHWPPERRHVEAGYRDLPFPFDEIEPPAFVMTQCWPLDAFLGYLATWSATQRFIEATRTDPIDAIHAAMAEAWGHPAAARTVRWPLHLRVGYNVIFR